MESFRQFTTNEHSPNYQWLIRNPLRLAVLSLCAIRVRWSESIPDNLDVGEFYLAETEFYKFGLKKSQQGKLRRVIQDLIKTKFIEKVENKTGSQRASIYRFKNEDVFDVNIPYEEQDGEQIENYETIPRDLAGINNNDKNDKNDKNVIRKKPIDKKNITIMEVFHKINPTINFGHKIHRNSINVLVDLFGYNEVLRLAQLAVSIQGQEYAPVITTPTELKNKIGKLGIYIKKENNPETKGIIL